MAQALLTPLHEDDYLTSEILADVRHKFVNGGVYAMASASENHNCISGNLYSRLLIGGNQDCRSFMGDMMLRLNSGMLFTIPMSCWFTMPATTKHIFKTSPCMVVEVLSNSIELTDRREKWAAYQKLQSLREYVLLALDRAYIEVCQRVNLRYWGMTVPGP